MSSRREQIHDAMKSIVLRENGYNVQPVECNLKGIEKLRRESYRCIAYNPSVLTPRQRIDKLVKWDQYIFHEGGLQELLKAFNKVIQIEERTQELEDELYQNFGELNEDMFNDLCTGKLKPNKKDLVSKPVAGPLCTSTPSTKRLILKAVRATPKAQPKQETPKFIKTLLGTHKTDTIPIGPNGTEIPRKALTAINWSQTLANVTRKFLMILFDRETLASSTLSGKPSPAFLDCGMPIKKPLDATKVKDLTHLLTSSLTMTEKEVRQAITTKCADENKMYRQRQEKMLKNKTPTTK